MLYPDPGEYLVHYTHSNIRLDRSQLGGAPQLSAVFYNNPIIARNDCGLESYLTIGNNLYPSKICPEALFFQSSGSSVIQSTVLLSVS